MCGHTVFKIEKDGMLKCRNCHEKRAPEAINYSREPENDAENGGFLKDWGPETALVPVPKPKKKVVKTLVDIMKEVKNIQ
jgi:hypothetical protein